MRDWQTAGALAAAFNGLAYVLGFAMMAVWDSGSQTLEPLARLQQALARKGALQAWHLLIYCGVGLGLLVMVAALRERWRQLATPWRELVAPLGWIWAGLLLAAGMLAVSGMESVARLYASDPAAALALSRALNAVQNGLGGGVELLGGLWVALISVLAWQHGQWSRALSGFGLAVGMAGIFSIVPAWAVLVEVFGLGQLLWFFWLAQTFWRGRKAEPMAG